MVKDLFLHISTGEIMNTLTSAVREPTPVYATLVPEDRRLDILPEHFGIHMMRVENRIYDLLSAYGPQYRGGYWHFYELSNGGFYMAPDCEWVRLYVAGNHFDDRVSGDAAGIVACLFAFSIMSMEIPDERFSRHFHALREFAFDHPESTAIFAAID